LVSPREPATVADANIEDSVIGCRIRFVAGSSAVNSALSNRGSTASPNATTAARFAGGSSKYSTARSATR
jgi:hypothetical protein